MDPVREQFSDLLAFPLRSHVASSMNSGEVKTALVVDEVAGDLTIGVPWSPRSLNIEVKTFNPSAGALSGYGTVGISRVEKHLVVILKEYLIDPEGSLKLKTILGWYFWAAHWPALNAIRNVKGTSDISTVDVVREKISHERLLSLEHWHITNPTDVFLESETCLISFDFISNLDSSLSWECVNSLWNRGWNSWLRIDLSEEIIPVESLPEIVDLTPESIADGAVWIRLLDIAEIEMTVVRSVVLQKAGRNDVEVFNNVGEWRWDVHVPVGSTVSNNETLQVVGLALLVNSDKLVMLMDLPSEVGDVDASVRLSRDIERVVEELRVSAIEVLNSSKSIARLSHIIVNAILWINTDWIADASRTFDIKHVCSYVPGIRIILDVVLTIVDNKGPMLLEKSEEWWAPWTAIEPHNNGVILGIV
jgi:hypothetical protein